MALIAPCTRSAALALLLLLAACGGGNRPADVLPSNLIPDPPVAVAGPDSFLRWLNNALRTPVGNSVAVDSLAYAQAYLRANDEATLPRSDYAQWRAANHFDAPDSAALRGEQVQAVFGDFRDLGYGRRMTARYNHDKADPTRDTIAFAVENYLVNPATQGYGAAINLDAAVTQDLQWRVSINAIEFSPGPAGGVKYIKFYSFDPATGARVLAQDMDGRGKKSLPGVCTSCHGGRADGLTHDAQLPLLQGGTTTTPLPPNGDVRSRLHPFEVDVLAFSAKPGYTRADQEALLKTLNTWVLCTYPYVGPAAIARPAEDQCRQLGDSGREGAAGAAEVIKQAYGGDGLPASRYTPPPVPAGWAGQPDLYTRVVAPACLACHRLLGTVNTPDITFSSQAGFDSYLARTRELVFSQGAMPLSRVIYQRFWSTQPTDGAMARTLADYLKSQGLDVPRDATGQPRQPGAPVARPGPDRQVVAGVGTRLSAAGSLFADSHRWRLVSGPNGAVSPAEASLAHADSAEAVFTATAAAKNQRYQVELVSTRNGVQSEPALLTLYVNDGSARSFKLADVETTLVNCMGCHKHSGMPLLAFDGSDGGGGIGDKIRLHNTLRSLLNFDDIGASQLLRKPSGEHHRVGGKHDGFLLTDTLNGAAVPVGDVKRRYHDLLVNWALAGAPP